MARAVGDSASVAVVHTLPTVIRSRRDMPSVYTYDGIGHVLQGLWLQVGAGKVVPFSAERCRQDNERFDLCMTALLK